MLTRSYGTLLTSPAMNVQYHRITVHSLVREVAIQLPEFQRELLVSHVERIQSTFMSDPSTIVENIIKFGTISHHDNKKPILYLVDGQHRIQALKQIVEYENNPNGTVSSMQVPFIIRFCKDKRELLEFYARLNRNTPMEHFVMSMIDKIPDSETTSTQFSAFTVYSQFGDYIKLYKPYISDSEVCRSPNIHYDTFMRYWKQSTEQYFEEGREYSPMRSVEDMKELFFDINTAVRRLFEAKVQEIRNLEANNRRVTKTIQRYEDEYKTIMEKHKKAFEEYKKKNRHRVVSEDELPPFFLGTQSNALQELKRTYVLDQFRIRIPKWNKMSNEDRDAICTKVWDTFSQGNSTMKCACCQTKVIAEKAHDGIEQCEYGHIIAERYGGEFTETNLRPVCRECNRQMSSIHMDDYIRKLNEK
jgi:5-methylcytosine-specific restriction endonuclease McrA